MLDFQGDTSGLPKISVACKTCEVSESFYSSLSVKRFRLEHMGHDVMEGGVAWRAGSPRFERTDGLQDAEVGGKVRLLKVLVELVMLPSYPAPVFTITGVKEDLKSAFVQVVSPSQCDQVKEILEKAKYLDSGSNDTVYVWDPKSISFSDSATLAMSFGPRSSSSPTSLEPSPAPAEPSRSDATPTSVEVQGIQIASSEGGRSAMATDDVAQTEIIGPLASPSHPDFAASHPPSEFFGPLEAAASPPAEPRDQIGRSSQSLKATRTRSAESEGSSYDGFEEEHYLLVSRSGYVEGGPKKMAEAVRISRLLRPFRWRIEPAYTIGVLVDDILSVETATGEIGSDMTNEIEDAGYVLSRVSVDKGRPVAWFKRQQAAEPGAIGF